MADTKISGMTAATDLSGATIPIVQGGANRVAAISLFAAAATDEEAASSSIVFTTPGVQHRHPSAAKGWVAYNQTGTPAVLASYNVTSVTDNATGDFTVNWDTDFSSANYAVVAVGGSSSFFGSVHARAAGTTNVTVSSDAGTKTDQAFDAVIAFGDQ